MKPRYSTRRNLERKKMSTGCSLEFGTSVQDLGRAFDANCYLALMAMFASHDLSRRRISSDITNPHLRVLKVLSMIKQPTLVVGLPKDMMFPFSEQLELADDTIALHCAAFSLVFEQLIELAAKRSGSVYKLRIHPA